MVGLQSGRAPFLDAEVRVPAGPFFLIFNTSFLLIRKPLCPLPSPETALPSPEPSPETALARALARALTLGPSAPKISLNFKYRGNMTPEIPAN